MSKWHHREDSMDRFVDPSFPVAGIVFSTEANEGSIDPSFVVSTDEEDPSSSRDFSLVLSNEVLGNDDGLKNHARHQEMSGSGVGTCASHDGNDSSSWTPSKDILFDRSFSLPGQIDGQSLQNYTLSAAMRKMMDDHMEYGLFEDGRITPPNSFFESPSVTNLAVLVDKNGKQIPSNAKDITPSPIAPFRSSCSSKVYVLHEDIKESDVIFGRGSGTNLHPGNIVYRSLIYKEQPKYKTLDNDGKKRMSERIIDWINETEGGRFLAFDETPVGKRHYVATKKQVQQKVSRALRGDKRSDERYKAANDP